jgi:uncharacterized protein YidB (DUF937 family)
MANPLLGQVLGSVFATAMRGRARRGPFGGGSVAGNVATAGLGGILGGMLGRGGLATGGRRGLGGNQGLLLAMLLPYAMQWVQRNGGVGAVLDRFRQKGMGPKADSWVSTGANQALRAEEADEVVGGEELSRMAHQLGIPEQEVAAGFAEIVPELVNQLSPEGQVPPEADDALDAARAELEKELSQLTQGAPV